MKLLDAPTQEVIDKARAEFDRKVEQAFAQMPKGTQVDYTLSVELQCDWKVRRALR